MNHQLYLKYLKEYTLDAMENSGESVALAADHLEKQSRPGMFSKDRVEKRAALTRVKKVFTSSRERSWYVVLKSLGFDDLAKEML